MWHIVSREGHLRDRMKVLTAIVVLGFAFAVVYMRRPRSLDQDAERWLLAHLEGNCSPILEMLTPEERRGIGLDDEGVCRVLKERVFPYTTKAKLLRIERRTSSETGGSCTALLEVGNAKQFSANGFAFRSFPRSVTRFRMSLSLAWAIRSRIDGSHTKDWTYCLPYLDEELPALKTLGFRELLLDNSYHSTISIEKYVVREKGSILLTKKYNDYIKLGTSHADALKKLQSEYSGSK